MKKASITDAKNQLSALIDRVKHGESVLITDRGRPVARLEAAVAHDAADPDGRLDRLERDGLLMRAAARPPLALVRRPPPRARRGASVVRTLLEERRDGR